MKLSATEQHTDKPYRMLILAPYDGFETMINKALAGRDDIIADVYPAPLDYVETVISGLNLDRYEVILCRGRSSLVASQLVKLPVVTVEFSPVDILRGLKLAAINQHKKMAFVSFFKMEETIRFLADFMNFPESSFLVPPPPKDAEDMQQLILSLHMEHGVDVFIGDGACTRIARQYGFEYVLITSGSECIESAISSAIEICDMGRGLINMNSFYKTALLNSGYNYAIFTEDKDVIDTNITHSLNGNRLLSAMKSHVSVALRHKIINWVTDSVLDNYKIKGTVFEHDNVRYVLFICAEAYKVSKRLSSFITYTEPEAISGDMHYVRNISSLNELLNQSMQQAPGLAPVMITGGISSGKTTFARAVYMSSAYTNSPLAEIDCQSVNKKNLLSLICDESSPLYESNIVLLLKNLEAMPIELQQELADAIVNMKLRRRVKIISTISGSLEELIPVNKLSSDLAYLLNGYAACMPSLHKNLEWVSSIARSYLNELNQTLPHQIAGFEQEALSCLADFKWVYGITQFKLTVKRLAVQAGTAFITAGEVKKVLSEYSEPASDSNSGDASTHDIDLSGSLDDITHRIIMQVLDEEDMNQSRAANRLGISRMTIWKHLNEKQRSSTAAGE